ncbi:MAG: MBL fold metallo-hydrolase [Bacteroidales bacterium]|nr:MBL fold metallo-hydrolase [Bacteroidales bacterium]
MIKIDRLVFNSFQVNTYIIYDNTGECLIIDPACYTETEKDALSNFINDHQLKPVSVVNTHCHVDHVLGIQHIKDMYHVPFLAHKLEGEMLENAPLMGELFGFTIDELSEPDQTLGHEDAVTFGDSELKAIHVPGHSQGSLAFYSKEGGFVVTGDALFEGSIGRTDLPGGDYDTLIKSIKDNLFSLPGETKIHPGHGGSSTISKEKSENPFFNDYKT